jgi:hypothetical protein
MPPPPNPLELVPPEKIKMPMAAHCPLWSSQLGLPPKYISQMLGIAFKPRGWLLLVVYSHNPKISITHWKMVKVALHRISIGDPY